MIFRQRAKADPGDLPQHDGEDMVVVSGIVSLKAYGDPWGEKGLAGRSMDGIDGWETITYIHLPGHILVESSSIVGPGCSISADGAMHC